MSAPKKAFDVTYTPGDALEGFKQRSDFSWAEFTKPQQRPKSDSAQRNDRILFTHQTELHHGRDGPSAHHDV